MSRLFVSQGDIERNTETVHDNELPDMGSWAGKYGTPKPGTGQAWPKIPTKDEARQVELAQRRLAASKQIQGVQRDGELELPILSSAQRQNLLISTLLCGAVGLWLFAWATGKPIIQ